MKKIAIIILLIIVAAAGCVWVIRKPVARPSKTPLSAQKTATFDKNAHSLSDPASLWVVVNKKRPLEPAEYAPEDLTVPKVALRLGSQNATMQVRAATARALEQLFSAAATNGTPLKLSSGYRSYSYQVSLYNGYVRDQGQTEADSQSARPGYSEHQTGLAADLEPLDGTCEVQTCFATTPAGQWLAANCYKYGFIVRYGKNDTAETGYAYEPWHVRYVGLALSKQLHQQHIATLEQFFGTGAASGY